MLEDAGQGDDSMNPAPPTPYPSFIICRAWAVFSVCKLEKGPESPDAGSAVDPL